jgi:hypothetical protein
LTASSRETLCGPKGCVAMHLLLSLSLHSCGRSGRCSFYDLPSEETLHAPPFICGRCVAPLAFTHNLPHSPSHAPFRLYSVCRTCRATCRTC